MNKERIDAVNTRLQEHKRNLSLILEKNGFESPEQKFKSLIPALDEKLTGSIEAIKFLTTENEELKTELTALKAEFEKIKEKGLAEYMTMLSNL